MAFAWALRAALDGSFYEGSVVLLGIGFALPGFFICRNYWDASPGVLTISIGFFCWGAVFPIVSLAGRFAPKVILPGALWDSPKLFVAFGMILAVVEDKSHAIRRMEHRAAEINRQLEQFSAITARLLSGAAPDTICPDIASAITELTSFSAALIHIQSPEGRSEAGKSYLSEWWSASTYHADTFMLAKPFVGPDANLFTTCIPQRVGFAIYS